MSDDLLNKKCLPCEGGVIPFDISEIHKYQKKVDGWDITEDKNKIFFLFKKFKFENFIKSQNFVNEVGKISEDEGHHPDISFGWGYAEIKITTHAIKGPHLLRGHLRQTLNKLRRKPCGTNMLTVLHAPSP